MATELEQSLTDKLTELGYSLSYVCTNAGGYHDSSEWQVTISRNNQTYSTTFSKGPGLRIWKATRQFPSTHAWTDKIKRGKRVELTWNAPNLLTVEECKAKGKDWQHQARVLEDFKLLTEPEKPTLPEVLSCLVSDANCVRFGQSFDEFCSDLGYDNDSRKAESTFNGCRDSWTGLVRLGANLDELDELFQNY